jgi:hypothetical protein
MKTGSLPVARGLGAAALALVLAAQPAFAAVKSGDSTCSPTNRLWIYSEASVDVYHNWKLGHYVHYPNNSYRQYHENNTFYSATWWNVQYDFEIDLSGAFCAPV